MDTYERVRYMDHGQLKTVTLRNVTEGAWTLSGTRINGHDDGLRNVRDESLLVINLTRGMVSRTPMRMNDAGTALEDV